MKKIIYIRGLWSSERTVDWIKQHLESSLNTSVELFDYHDLLVQKIDNATYLKLVLEKYGDFYGGLEDVNLIGHSHGGTLATLISKKYLNKKLILVNPALRPWGIFRRISHLVKKDYEPHFEIKYEGEKKERTKYFADNFDIFRDTSRIFYTGSRARDRLELIKSNLLLIQSLKDEFISARVNIDFYNSLAPEVDKEIMIVQNGEHAVLEERGEYPKIYRKVAQFMQKKCW